MGLISQLDWPRILYSRTAAILLGIAAAFSIPAVFFMHSGVNPETLGPAKGELISIVAGVGGVGFVLLLLCMGAFWLKCDVSSRLNRTIWFVLLPVGFAYGSHIAYYVIVYLPVVLRRIRNANNEPANVEPPLIEEGHKRLGPFSRALLIGWAYWVLAVLAVVALPKTTQLLTALVAVGFVLWSLVVIFESVVHFIRSIYRSGMRRQPRA